MSTDVAKAFFLLQAEINILSKKERNKCVRSINNGFSRNTLFEAHHVGASTKLVANQIISNYYHSHSRQPKSPSWFEKYNSVILDFYFLEVRTVV